MEATPQEPQYQNARTIPEETGQELAGAGYSLQQLRTEHETRKGLLYRMIEKIRGKEKQGPENLSGIRNDEAEKLAEAGLDVDKVPEFMRPLYIRMQNLLRNPERRFKNQKVGLESLVSGLREVEQDVKDIIYGRDYNPSKGEASGLYGALMVMGQRRHDFAKAVGELEQEIAATYQREQETNMTLKAATTFEEKDKLNRAKVSFHYDRESYEQTKREIIRELKKVDDAVTETVLQKKEMDSLKTYLADQIDTAERVLGNYQTTGRTHDFTKAIADIVPKMQDQLKAFIHIGDAFESYSNGQRAAIAKVTQCGLDVSTEKKPRPDPFEGAAVKREKDDERIMARVKAITDNPFDDIFES